MTGIERGARRRAPAAGFTMIELLVVVSLIIILAGIGMAQYRNGVIRAQEATLREDLFQIIINKITITIMWIIFVQ